jgi:uncharacterized protein YecE (DUF72 family)
VADIRVGICAWADPALIESGTFYPRRSLSPDARLRFYATVFDTVEINATYYAIPSVLQVRRWADRTPPGFLFNAKAWAPMTGHHPKPESLPAEVRVRLPAAPRRTPRGEIHRTAFGPDALEACFEVYRQALAPLAEADKLGYVLFQFAPWVRFGDRALDYVASLRARLPAMTIAVEFRHRSWFPEHAAETLAVLRQAGLAHVVVDAPATPNAVPRVVAATAATAVLRLHGRHAPGWLAQLRGERPSVREKYDYLYTEAELTALVPEVQALAGEAERVIVSFNNNNRDYPVVNALMMRRLLGQPPPPDALPGRLFA